MQASVFIFPNIHIQKMSFGRPGYEEEINGPPSSLRVTSIVRITVTQTLVSCWFIGLDGNATPTTGLCFANGEQLEVTPNHPPIRREL